MMGNQRGFANVVVVVIVVAILGVAGYFIFMKKSETTVENTAPTETQATPPAPKEDTTSWQTYQNTKYGYELKYPPDAAIETKGDNITVTNLMDIKPTNAMGKCSDLRDVKVIVSCLGSVSWAKEDKLVPVTIGGLPAVRRETTLKPAPRPGSNISPVGYIFYVNSGTTGLEIMFEDSTFLRPLMQQVLNTLKFSK